MSNISRQMKLSKLPAMEVASLTRPWTFLTPKKLLLWRTIAELALSGMNEVMAVAVEVLDAVKAEDAVVFIMALTTALTLLLPMAALLTSMLSSAAGATILSSAICATNPRRTRTKTK